MGCTQFSKSTFIIKTIPKSPASKLNIETVNTLSQTNLILQNLSVGNPSSSSICLKIEVLKPFSDFIIEDFTGLDPFTKEMHNIRKFWLLFTALKTSFDTQVHSICIKNYTLKKGFIVLSIYALVKCGQSGAILMNSSPFIKTRQNLDAVKAWNELINFLCTFKKQNHIEMISEYIDSLSIFVKNNENCKFIKKAIKYAKNYIEVSSKSIEEVKEILSENVKEEIYTSARQAYANGWTSAKLIVHNCLR